MPKRNKIRWRESDTDELQRIINNYNAKLYRIKKKNPEIAEYLPERASKKKIMGDIETRADFRRITNSLQRFSRRGSEELVKSPRGAKATKYEINEFKIKERAVNAQRTKARKKIEEKEVKIGGKGTGKTRAEMGSIKENSLKNSNKNFNSKSQKEWDLARKNIDNQLNRNYILSKQQLMKENYLKGLEENGFLSAMPEIEDFIRNMDFDKFLETVETDDTATFDFYKDPIAWEARKAKIQASWYSAYKEYIKDDYIRHLKSHRMFSSVQNLEKMIDEMDVHTLIDTINKGTFNYDDKSFTKKEYKEALNIHWLNAYKIFKGEV